MGEQDRFPKRIELPGLAPAITDLLAQAAAGGFSGEDPPSQLEEALRRVPEVEDVSPSNDLSLHVLRHRGYELTFCSTHKVNREADVLAWLRDLDVSACPEVVDRIRLDDWSSVLIKRYPGCERGRLVPVQEALVPPSEQAQAAFRRDMRVLLQHGRVHVAARRGFFHRNWLVNPRTGALFLDHWLNMCDSCTDDDRELLADVDDHLWRVEQWTGLAEHRPPGAPFRRPPPSYTDPGALPGLPAAVREIIARGAAMAGRMAPLRGPRRDEAPEELDAFAEALFAAGSGATRPPPEPSPEEALAEVPEVAWIDRGYFRYRDHEITIGSAELLDPVAEVLEWLRDLQLTSAPEIVGLAPFAENGRVLITRFRPWSGARLAPARESLGPFSAPARTAFREDMRRLLERGLVHSYAVRGYAHWLVDPGTGAIFLRSWKGLRECSPHEPEEAMERFDWLLDNKT